MNKTQLLLVIMMIAVTPAVLASNLAFFSINVASYSPVPAEPGSYVTVILEVINEGDAASSNAAVEFIDNFPFSLDDESKRVVNIGTLQGKGKYLIEYRVRIDSSALQGTNYLKFRHTSNGNQWVERDIALSVNSVQKTISINSIKVEPEIIRPGTQARMVLKVKNLASSTLRDVSMQLDLEKKVVGATLVDLPFAPVGSSSEKMISLLRSGETADFEFSLQSYPTAEAGIYKMPVILSYTDDAGNSYIRTELFGVVIGASPNLLVQVESSNLAAGNSKGEVNVRITNRGYDRIRFASLAIGESNDYEVVSTNKEFYVGNIDSDDYNTATIELRVPNSELKSISIPIELVFKDAMNTEYTIEDELVLKLRQAQGNGGQTTTALLVLLVIVIVIAGIVIARKKRANK